MSFTQPKSQNDKQSNRTILGPEDGKVILEPSHKFTHKEPGEDTGR
jgi:hypothetical protein